MINEADISLKMAKAYNLKIKKIELLHDAVKKIFRIKTKNTTFILKLFTTNDHTAQQITYERKLIQHLTKHKINCASAIDILLKEEITYKFRNESYYGILTKESNKAPYAHDQHRNIQNKLFGQSLFDLHNCPTPNFENPPTDTTSTQHLKKTLKKNTVAPYAVLLNRVIQDLYQDINSTSLYGSNQLCVCHGDAWPGNALYSSKKCILIDFEHSRIADPSFDIATFIWWLTSTENKTLQQLSIWNSFKSGYGPTVEKLINHNTPKLIKINQLRSLVFIYNNILVTEEIFQYISNQTLALKEKLNHSSCKSNLLATLWKS